MKYLLLTILLLTTLFGRMEEDSSYICTTSDGTLFPIVTTTDTIEVALSEGHTELLHYGKVKGDTGYYGTTMVLYVYANNVVEVKAYVPAKSFISQGKINAVCVDIQGSK